MQLAITHELVGLRVQPKAAANAARKFTHESQPGRKPGELFEHFKTLLLLTPDDSYVKNVGYHTSVGEINGSHACVIAVDLNRIVATVNQRLTSIKGKK